MGFCFFNNVAVAAREALPHPGEAEGVEQRGDEGAEDLQHPGEGSERKLGGQRLMGHQGP